MTRLLEAPNNPYAAFDLPEGDWRLRIDTARERIACDEEVSDRVCVGWQSVLVLVAPE